VSPRRTLYAAEARADWQNLFVMAAEGGRPVLRRTVKRLGRAAGVPSTEVARVADEIGAAS